MIEMVTGMPPFTRRNANTRAIWAAMENLAVGDGFIIDIEPHLKPRSIVVGVARNAKKLGWRFATLKADGRVHVRREE